MKYFHHLTKKAATEFPPLKFNTETPIPTGKSVTPKKGNKKTFLKLEAKISAIKSYLDSEVSAFSNKKTPSLKV